MPDTRLTSEVAAFLDAVSRHVAFGLGADPAAPEGERRMSEARAAALAVLADAGALEAAHAPERFEAAARALLANQPLLAAFFQNLDLLQGGRASTAVAMLLMRIMEL